MDTPIRFRDFVMTVLKRSLASWHGNEGWMALFAYIAIAILPFLLAGAVSSATNQVVSNAIERTISYVAVSWLFLLVIIITPFRLWREQVKEIDSLSELIDNKKQKIDALSLLGNLWEQSTDALNRVVRWRLQNTHISGDDAIRLNDLESQIIDQIKIISPGEASMFKTLGSYNSKDHPEEYYPDKWGGDKRLLEFSERLLRVRRFIDKHSPPS